MGDRAHKAAVLNVVGLSPSVLGPHTPRLNAMVERGHIVELTPDLPAVTCTSQSSMLTGLPVSGHGVVGNGWYDRESNEPRFWKQSNGLVHGEKIWETARARDPGCTTANLFWWFNMYSSADFSVTPRPRYKADGRKKPDCYSRPAGLRDRLQDRLGPFPLFRFWGPMAGIASTRWIADAARLVDEWHDPTLSLVYLPHLDYALQKHGPGTAQARHAAAEIDAVVGGLVDHFESRGARVMVVSEYGIEPVENGGGPIHPNRVLRRAGLVEVRTEDGTDLLDCGACRAFAIADHQVAHVYARDEDSRDRAREVLQNESGVERVLDRAQLEGLGLAHERSGDLLAVAKAGHWFTYYHWLDDARAPDFARTVEIHRKPGYDPCELFVDPRIRLPRLTLARKLAMKKIGLRTLMDVIPLDASLVRGSHGRVEAGPEHRPMLIAARPLPAQSGGPIPMRGVHGVILDHLFGE
ncbi:MAG: putative AlkP superfamily pyrophosphatase or phosphodiesterase [Phycisphaerales bacterium]|jgi:predicted AlkP superfamily pyrophosphatase or phosphodiesterase